MKASSWTHGGDVVASRSAGVALLFESRYQETAVGGNSSVSTSEAVDIRSSRSLEISCATVTLWSSRFHSPTSPDTHNETRSVHPVDSVPVLGRHQKSLKPHENRCSASFYIVPLIPSRCPQQRTVSSLFTTTDTKTQQHQASINQLALFKSAVGSYAINKT